LAASWRYAALTGRRDPNAHQETWLVYHADVHAGTSGFARATRSIPINGNGAAASILDPECKNGTAASYEAARSAFSRRRARVSVEPNRG
jgi:hypothetical protein